MDDHHIIVPIGKIEAGEGSSGHDQPVISMDMEERFRNLMEEGDQARAVEALGTNCPSAKIQKAMFLLRDYHCFVKYFEPRVASLGPIHHGNPKYELGEKYTRRLTYEFVQGCGKSINLLYEEVKKEIKQLRECFEEEVTKKYDDKALAWMLFVDGCAILQYTFCAAKNKFVEFKIKDDSVTFAQQDLFLLENQVPYGLLKLLMSLSEKEELLRSSIQSYIRNVTHQQTEPQLKQEERGPMRTTLLGVQKEDAFRAKSLPGSSKSDPPSGKTRRIWPWRKKGGEDPDWQSCRNVQKLKAAGIRLKRHKKDSCLRNIRFNTQSRQFRFYPGYLWLPPITVDDSTGKTRGIWSRRKKGREDPDWQSYRKVQELKSAGIQLKQSKNSSLRNIRFTRKFGRFFPRYLWLPPITVDDSTGPKFMNLIAYEMCLDFDNDFGISSYMSFLDSLIDEVNDVKDMRKAQVLHNFLGSDQEVADLFNAIGTDLVPNAETYKDVKIQIQKYYENS